MKDNILAKFEKIYRADFFQGKDLKFRFGILLLKHWKTSLKKTVFSVMAKN